MTQKYVQLQWRDVFKPPTFIDRLTPVITTSLCLMLFFSAYFLFLYCDLCELIHDQPQAAGIEAPTCAVAEVCCVIHDKFHSFVCRIGRRTSGTRTSGTRTNTSNRLVIFPSTWHIICTICTCRTSIFQVVASIPGKKRKEVGAFMHAENIKVILPLKVPVNKCMHAPIIYIS